MGIYIKGMKMPKNCYECPFGTVEFYNRSDEFVCNITGKMTGLNKCPLTEVPPHGRLIDADASIDVAEGRVSPGQTTISAFLLNHIEGMVPLVVIPAEESN